MSMREAPGRRLEWIDTRIEIHFSNFLFIDRQYRSHSVLRRIFSLARMHHYQSLLIEELSEDTCPLLAEENAALSVRKLDYQGSTTHRLSFWRCLPDSPTKPEDFVGYAVFKSDRFNGSPLPLDYIFEAVMPPVRLEGQNNFVHCRRNYAVETAAGTQTVNGVLYAQQNDLTFVCAHVSMRSALACLLPEGDISYARMNALAGVDHQTNRVGEGGRGLGPPALEAILAGLAIPYEKVIHEPSRNHHLQTEFQRDLYGIIESGGPALIGFELGGPNAGSQGAGRHLVPVIGHTFNDDAWVPDAQRSYFGGTLGYFSSESWLSSYVLHDDNFGPYYCLPRHFLKNANFRLMLGLKRHFTAVSAIEAEAVGLNVFNIIAGAIPGIGQAWYDRFIVYSNQRLLVLRSLLVEKAAYIRHLREMRCWDNTALEEAIVNRLERLLPDRFWMIEASAQELFTASRRKFGEVLLSCTTPLSLPLNMSILQAARLPGLVLTFDSGGGLEALDSQLQGHTPIFSAEANA